MKSNIADVILSVQNDINELLSIDYYHLDLGDINNIMFRILHANNTLGSLHQAMQNVDAIFNLKSSMEQGSANE